MGGGGHFELHVPWHCEQATCITYKITALIVYKQHVGVVCHYINFQGAGRGAVDGGHSRTWYHVVAR